MFKPLEHLTREEISSRPLLAKKLNAMIDLVNRFEKFLDLQEGQAPEEKTSASTKRKTKKRDSGTDG